MFTGLATRQLPFFAWNNCECHKEISAQEIVIKYLALQPAFTQNQGVKRGERKLVVSHVLLARAQLGGADCQRTSGN